MLAGEGCVDNPAVLVYICYLIVFLLVLCWFSILFCWVLDYYHLVDDSLNIINSDGSDFFCPPLSF